MRDGDGWVVNGSKIFISGADRADYGIVFARTDPARGRAGVTCFIVETGWPGFHVRRVVHTLRSANYATELQFEDLRVPAANVLGEVGGGFAIANDRLSRQRIPYAAGCIGVAIAAQEMAIEYARLRETFGAPLATRQSVQNMIIDSQVDIESARWLTLAAAEKAHRGEPFRKEAGRWRSWWRARRAGAWWTARSRSTAATASPRTSPSSAGTGDADPADRRGSERGPTAYHRPRPYRRVVPLGASASAARPRTARSGLASPERTLLAASNQEHGNRPERPGNSSTRITR